MFAFIFFLALSLSNPSHIQAIYDPLTVANNAFGIHIADVNDLLSVSPLINSTGGDWGYVTLVIPDTDKNTDKWNGVFNTMRRLHMIPIVRIATHMENEAWVKPKEDDIKDMVRFLNSLAWPIENRYIVLFNEPNHAKEWGDTLDPEGYAEIALKYAQALKSSSDDYFILPAALDVSASNSSISMDSAQFLMRMIARSPEFMQVIDGWNSHSYPNPAFSGSPNASGRGTLRSYQWEISYLRSLGVEKYLPVFITETGWEHREGKTEEYALYPSETIASFITEASRNVWRDPQIVAITPFVFSYQDIPFDHFSWKMLGVDDYYIHAQAYQAIQKTKGRPKQRQSYKIGKYLLPLTFVTGSIYELKTTIKNIGQNILDPREGYQIQMKDTTQRTVFYQEHSVPYLEPDQEGELNISLSTPSEGTSMHVIVSIGRDSDYIVLDEKYIRLVPPPSLTLTASFGFKKHMTDKQAKILVYDSSQKLIHEYESMPIIDGKMSITGLRNIIPGQKYRIVIVSPGYIPSQIILPLSKEDTFIEFPMILPFDIDEDGAFTTNDVLRAFYYKPIDIWRRLF
jgi:hypothetical protein